MGYSVVDRMGRSRKCMSNIEAEGPDHRWMALAGKLMGYAGLGTVRQEYVDKIKKLVLDFSDLLLLF